jgi:disulfide oxidoreductase YuzD
MLPRIPPLRKYLHADALFQLVRTGFERLSDARQESKVQIPLADALMAAFALFSLKDPSLLAFEDRRGEANLHSIYLIDQVPCDSQMRTILDPLDPELLRAVFRDVFRQLQRGKALEPLVYLNGCYLLSLDGTGYFSSSKIHCASCLEQAHAKGTVTYSHQMLGGVLLHPDLAPVIPLAPEPIVKQDGTAKNDCERNAARRFLAKFRRDHPQLPVIVIEDGLAANGPHLRDLKEHGCHFILGVQEGDHDALFTTGGERLDTEQFRDWHVTDRKRGVEHYFLVWDQVPLNASHPDLLVNVLRYRETPIGQDEAAHEWVWITDLEVTAANVRALMRGGRARWKIENETFNTLKNQGYHYEHNFGHGEKQLSVVFASLMMLAFLVDQVQQLGCRLFQLVRAKLGSNRLLWDRMRAIFYAFQLSSMRELLEALYRGFLKPKIRLNSS